MNNKTLLVDAIIGKGFSSMVYAGRMVKAGLASFTGNQWNPDWEWDRNKLDTMSELDLKKIYLYNVEDEPTTSTGDFMQWDMKTLSEKFAEDVDNSLIKQLSAEPLDLRKYAATASAKGFAKKLNKEILYRLTGDIT